MKSRRRIALLSITLGVCLIPASWRFGYTSDRDEEENTIMWHLFLGPFFITLGAEEE